MQKISTHSSETSENCRFLKAATLMEKSSKGPRLSTILKIRQFARCYQPVIALGTPALADIIVN